jgi:hypothetical protein
MEPPGSLPRTKDLIAGIYPELNESSLHLPIFKNIFYLRQIFFSFRILQKMLCVLLFSLIRVTCAAYIFFFILLPESYLVKTANYEASNYKIFPGHLISVLSFAQFPFGSLPLI